MTANPPARLADTPPAQPKVRHQVDRGGTHSPIRTVDVAVACLRSHDAALPVLRNPIVRNGDGGGNPFSQRGNRLAACFGASRRGCVVWARMRWSVSCGRRAVVMVPRAPDLALRVFGQARNCKTAGGRVGTRAPHDAGQLQLCNRYLPQDAGQTFRCICKHAMAKSLAPGRMLPTAP